MEYQLSVNQGVNGLWIKCRSRVPIEVIYQDSAADEVKLWYT